MTQSVGVVPELQPAVCAAPKHVPIIASVPGSSRLVLVLTLYFTLGTVLHLSKASLIWK